MTLMHSSIRRTAIATAIMVSAAATPAPAFAQAARPNGYPITNVNLRAGPGTEYPVIVTVPGRAPITILGCLSDYTWCDSVFQGNRGWMRSIYLSGYYQGNYYSLGDYAPRLGYRTVSFDIEGYWGANYRNRPFYGERARWTRRPREEGYVDTGVFYDRLAPYGSWVWIQGQYVWVPAGVDRSWRPYTRGRWVFTDRGWTWVSYEPFGWATYHYGRWGFSNRVGWFWVPGSRWAPAWVSWRQSDDYLAWAPMPPAYDGGININVSIGTVPDYYWQVVPSRAFLSNDLQQQIVRDRDRQRPILERSRPLGNTTITNNNVVVNNVVNLTYVEEKTQEKVVERRLARARDAKDAGKVEGDAVEIFQPAAKETPADLAPPKPKKIEEVAKESETKDQAEGEATTEEMLIPPEIQKATEESKAAKRARGKASKDGGPMAPASGGEAPLAPSLPKGGEASAPPPEGAAAGGPVPAEDLTPAAKDLPPPPAHDAGPPANEEGLAPDAAAPPPPPPAEDTAPPAPKATDKTEPQDLPAMTPSPPEETPLPVEEPKPKKEGKGQKAKGNDAPPPPAPAMEEAAPPPSSPPPPMDEPAPKPKKEGRGNGNKAKDNGGGPPPAMEDVAPPPPLAEEPAPRPKREGKGMGDDGVSPPYDGDGGDRPRKGKNDQGPAPCPEGTIPADDGSCMPQ